MVTLNDAIASRKLEPSTEVLNYNAIHDEEEKEIAQSRKNKKIRVVIH